MTSVGFAEDGAEIDPDKYYYNVFRRGDTAEIQDLVMTDGYKPAGLVDPDLSDPSEWHGLNNGYFGDEETLRNMGIDIDADTHGVAVLGQDLIDAGSEPFINGNGDIEVMTPRDYVVPPEHLTPVSELPEGGHTPAYSPDGPDGPGRGPRWGTRIGRAGGAAGVAIGTGITIYELEREYNPDLPPLPIPDVVVDAAEYIDETTQWASDHGIGATDDPENAAFRELILELPTELAGLAAEAAYDTARNTLRPPTAAEISASYAASYGFLCFWCN